MLCHIIAVLIDDQGRSACVKFVQHGGPGGFFAVFQHALNDSTTIRMHGQAVHLAGKCVDDELNMHRRNPLDGFLYDMIAVLIFDAFEHMLFEFSNQLRLLIGQNMLKSLITLARQRDTPLLVPSYSPSGPPGTRTSAARALEYGSSFGGRESSSAPGSRARRIFGSHNCQIHRSWAVVNSGGFPEKLAPFRHCSPFPTSFEWTLSHAGPR